jgi:FlaA1/EpsC-like NDP-sugar epimerase
MTIRTLVDLERRHLRRSELSAGALLAVAMAAVIVALGAVALARSRWLELPRGLPVVIWVLIAVAVAALAMRTRMRLVRRASQGDVAQVIEREQGIRRGALVGALELEGQGPLAARAAQHIRGSLPVDAPLAAAAPAPTMTWRELA